MANFNVTPNMNLPNPVPGVDPGPDYAANIQSCINITDQHNHSAGQGVLIQPNGLNISSDLPFNGNNAVALRSVRFLSQGSPIPNVAPDIGILYVSGNELWYNDYNGGNQVQITTNGLINATSSGISSGTASASFSAGTLVVKSSSTSFANVDLQSVVLSNAGNLTNQLTLLAPTLSSSYDLTLPTIPAQTNVMTLDSSGNMGSITYDVVGQGMTSVGADAIADSRTRSVGSTVPAGGVAVSVSSGLFSITNSGPTPVTNMSVTITTTGRPVMLMVQPDASANPSSLRTLTSNASLSLYFYRGSTQLTVSGMQMISTSGNVFSVLTFVDIISAGTYTYTLQATAIGQGEVLFAVLVAYEL